MFKELVEFTAAELKIDQMVNDLENEVQAKINEATSLRRKYQEMLVEDVTNEKKRKSNEYADQQAKVDAAVKEVAELEDRLRLLKDAKTDKLTKMIPSLHEGYSKAVGQATDEVQAEIDRLMECRIEYLRQVQRIHEKMRVAKDINDGFKTAARTVTDQFERQFLHLPEINLFNNHAGDDKVHGILQHEVERVIGTGQLPAWIERGNE